LWTEYIESEDFIEPQYAALGAPARKQLKDLFVARFALLAKP
jgi:hypothetical protein